MKCVMPLPCAPVEHGDDPLLDDEQTIACDRAEDFTETTDGRDGTRPPAFAQHALPDGTLIEGFRILKPIGEGGFGIVYLAWDCALERHVAIKEYMPSSLAVRASSLFEVSARSERDRGTFDAGLKSFVNEARLLARFDHPALVKVLRFWEGNRTAYMAMPFYEGPTLKTVLAAPGAPPSEAQLRAWLRPLLHALAAIHRENCYHRDISPDNILLTNSGPVLLDFGAARRVISDMTQALTAVLKPGFAPIEQYGGEMMQGPWTDLYALAGVVHYAITGRPPLASAVRIINDTHRPLAVARAGHYSDGFLRAIDAALAVRPDGRPQDVAQFCALLGESLAPDSLATVSRPASLPDNAQTTEWPHSIEAYPSISREVPLTLSLPQRGSVSPRNSTGAGSRRRAVISACALVASVAIGAWWMSTQNPAPHATVSDSAAPASRVSTPVATAGASVSPREVAAARQPDDAARTGPGPAPVAVAVPVSLPSSTKLPPTLPEPALASLAASAPAVQEPASTVSRSAPVVSQSVDPLPEAGPLQAPVVPATLQTNRAVTRPVRRQVAAAPAATKNPKLETIAAVAPEPQRLASIAPDLGPSKESVKPQRCGDLVLKSSLETLNSAEFAYLKKECR